MYMATILFVMRHRVKNIMKRSSGFMLNCARSAIQRFNPACRASRVFPSLPLSRLLMSLNDFDLPVFYVHINRNPPFYVYMRNILLKLYQILHVFSWMPPTVRTIFVDTLLVYVAYNIILQIIKPTSLTISFLSLTPAFILIFLPIALLSLKMNIG